MCALFMAFSAQRGLCTVQGTCCPFSAVRTSMPLRPPPCRKYQITALACAEVLRCMDCAQDAQVINWEDSVDVQDELVAYAWAYAHLSPAVVEANLADASTYREIVQRLPLNVENIRDLFAFRDNVTRKLAPTVAQAFASGRGRLSGDVAIIVEPPAYAVDVRNSPGDVPAPVAVSNLNYFHTATASSSNWTAADAYSEPLGNFQESQKNYAQASDAQPAQPHGSAAAPQNVVANEERARSATGTRRRRGSRRLAGRSLLAGAGRQGTAEAEEHEAGARPAAWI